MTADIERLAEMEREFKVILGDTMVGWTGDLQWAYNQGRAHNDAKARNFARAVALLKEDASGRPVHLLLVQAANCINALGGGPMEDCLRLKAEEIAALLAEAEAARLKEELHQERGLFTCSRCEGPRGVKIFDADPICGLCLAAEESARLRAALEKYGQHHGDCEYIENGVRTIDGVRYCRTEDRPALCTCGFDKALEGGG